VSTTTTVKPTTTTTTTTTTTAASSHISTTTTTTAKSTTTTTKPTTTTTTITTKVPTTTTTTATTTTITTTTKAPTTTTTTTTTATTTAATTAKSTTTTATSTSTSTSTPTVGPYTWGRVKIGGGGFVPSIIFNPTQENLIYARTDVGGSYRWNETTQSWKSLSEWIPSTTFGYVGSDALATDPVDPTRLYIAAGLYSNSWDPNNGLLLLAGSLFIFFLLVCLFV
ncbi:hypothetical protein HK100_010737, partial [Physocladia obscura]